MLSYINGYLVSLKFIDQFFSSRRFKLSDNEKLLQRANSVERLPKTTAMQKLSVEPKYIKKKDPSKYRKRVVVQDPTEYWSLSADLFRLQKVSFITGLAMLFSGTTHA